MTGVNEEIKPKLRELFIKSRVYRLSAYIFAVCGFILFIFLYSQRVEDSMTDILRNPSVIVILLTPFLPAAVLSWLAVRMERRMATLLETEDKPT